MERPLDGLLLGRMLNEYLPERSPLMKRFLCLLALSLPLLTTAQVGTAAEASVAGQILIANQAYGSRGENRAFRSCMREKYGPRYFAGVRRAQRHHMAQACTGPKTRHG